MRLALVSDAWAPQVNGVVRTLTTTVAQLRGQDHEVLTLTPDAFRTVPCPTYPEIRLALGCRRQVARRLEAFVPDALHIATEGPLGWAARGWALRTRFGFTTSFHTHFPRYLALRTRLPERLFWPAVVRFHGAAARTFAAAPTLDEELRGRGIARLHRWSRGVDLDQFSPGTPPHPAFANLPRPIQLYVGRVAVEKNIEAFLKAAAPGTKVVVGDGPMRAELARRYPDALFLGALRGEPLAAAYAGADVLVFPSLTDTFGLVMIEALASGTPVAAFPVAGPLDILGADARGRNGEVVGCLNANLGRAITQALVADPAACRAEAAAHSWNACTAQFLAGLHPNQVAAAA